MAIRNRMLLIIAAALFAISLKLPYWSVTMSAPTYPEKNLKISVYATKYVGDIKEWNVVGKLVGVQVPPPFPPVVFTVAPLLIAGFAVLTVVAAFRERWRKPAAVAPWVFLIGTAAYLQYILYQYGHNLDPERPLRYIKDFTPPVIGIVTVGKIRTFHVPDAGAVLFVVAAVLIFIAARAKSPARSQLAEKGARKEVNKDVAAS